MDYAYWHKQTKDNPLFPNLLWSRPENRRHAGKLLILGGNAHEFTAPALAYNEAHQAGAGTIRTLLPDALEKTVSNLVPEAAFAPSTPSGSFATKALGEITIHTPWADGVLLAGSFGKNSETAVVLEELLRTYSGQLTLADDAIDYFLKTPEILRERPETTVVATMSQLQQFVTHSQHSTPITHTMDLMQLVRLLHEYTTHIPLNIITHHMDAYLVASAGNISTTPQTTPAKSWHIATAAHTATWWLQNPTNAFEALTTSVFTP